MGRESQSRDRERAQNRRSMNGPLHNLWCRYRINLGRKGGRQRERERERPISEKKKQGPNLRLATPIGGNEKETESKNQGGKA